MTLVNTPIAGAAYYDSERTSRGLDLGQELLLRREPGNRYDGRAIEILTLDGDKLGYVRRALNTQLAAMMDVGEMLVARVVKIGAHGAHDALIGISWCKS